MTATQPFGKAGRVAFEPVMTAQFLPRCGNCEAPHPRARKPVLDQDACPECGTNSVTAPAFDVPVNMTGPLGIISNTLLKIGRALNKLAQEF